MLKSKIAIGWDCDSIITAFVDPNHPDCITSLLATLGKESSRKTRISFEEHQAITSKQEGTILLRFIDGNHRMGAVDELIEEGKELDRFWVRVVNLKAVGATEIATALNHNAENVATLPTDKLYAIRALRP